MKATPIATSGKRRQPLNVLPTEVVEKLVQQNAAGQHSRKQAMSIVSEALRQARKYRCH